MGLAEKEPSATDRALVKQGKDYLTRTTTDWNYYVSPSTGSFTTSAANVTIT